ncbi:hypothetical protein DFH09DRAFT_1426340 [Mycena vulgaris]|nr:hypothetical protein DFH09DRAFT_1426340 [Mycena vulgaris]
MSLSLKKHVKAQANLQEEIRSAITHTVDGMFLLTKLHIESLSAKATIKGIREALQALPMTINDSYDNAMKQIVEQNED